MALCHSGMDKASVGFLGIGIMVVVFKFRCCFGFTMPSMARVRMVRTGAVEGGGNGSRYGGR
ncbi:hypothetical protein HanIR_Chr15g0737161 [Helianthus annuus]|nr:hypothetical protein HanIR_Chr15g0737161 [Helianthus annuus]